MEGGLISCKNGGCLGKYREEENAEESCAYHPGKPIFHDFKKGWTCCKVTVLDWDEFAKIAGCARGRHCATRSAAGDQSDFYKSETVARAERGAEREEAAVRGRSVVEFGQAEEARRTEAQRLEDLRERRPLLTPEGRFKCANAGCNKQYTAEENSAEACSHHAGQPIFHDTKKFWSCCPQRAVYDWDEFMKIAACQKGPHQPKTAVV